MKAAIYIRVSTEEQAKEGYSISAQTQKLRAFCVSQEWEIAGLYADEGISAKDMERPRLQQMIKDIKDGKVDCVLVYRLDRLTRSVLDLYKMLEIFDKYDCKFKSATEVYDTTTAMGRMFVTIVAALAQWERENMGERIAIGYEEKVRQGKYAHNGILLGYDIDNETYVLQVNEKEAQTVRNIFELYKYQGMNRVARILNERHEFTKKGEQWSDVTIAKILKNPVYIGKIRWNDKIHDGLHDPIIDNETWEMTQMLIKERASAAPRTISSDYIFSGKLKCPSCGNSLVGYFTAATLVDGTRNKYYHYRCRRKIRGRCGGSRSVSETQMEISFLNYLKSADFGTHLNTTAEIGKDKLNEQPVKIDKDKLKIDLEKIERRKKKWQYAWTEELINDNDFKKRMEEENEEEIRIQSMLECEEEETENFNADEIADVLKEIEKNWHTLERKEKKSLVNSIIDNIGYYHVASDSPAIAISKVEFKIN